jgi:hypothetical protein
MVVEEAHLISLCKTLGTKKEVVSSSKDCISFWQIGACNFDTLSSPKRSCFSTMQASSNNCEREQ